MSIIVQYPASQFEYIASGRSESEAAELLAAWTAAHHPALIETDTHLPRWEPGSYPPFNLQQDTIIIPNCCDAYWNDEWAKQTADCVLIKHCSTREEIVQQILQTRDIAEHPFDEDLINDCYAFALARLLLALIGRHMHYMQTPDETRLKVSLNEAVQAYRNHQPENVSRALRDAFEELAQSKDNYYPAQNYFIELLLITEKTAGETLRKELAQSNTHKRVNLFLPCSVLAALPQKEPETFAALKTAVEQDAVRFIVDDYNEEVPDMPLNGLPILDAADRLLAGISLYRELLNVSPKIFGRQKTGLSAALPQLLKLLEMSGAVHFAPLDGWRIKEQKQSKVIWQGDDGSNIDALVRYPMSPMTAFAFFEFADQLGEQSSDDHSPTSVFALFPGQQSEWLAGLHRIAHYTDYLGKFADIESYFDMTAQSGGVQQFGEETYPVPTVPIPLWNDVYRRNIDRLTQSAFSTLLTLLKRQPQDGNDLAAQFVAAISGSGTSTAREGTIAANPLSFPLRINNVPPMGYAVVKALSQSTIKQPTEKKGLLSSFFSSASKPEPVLARQAEDDLGKGHRRSVFILENRYFSAKFDAVTGILRSIFTNRSRHNRLSRQIACRCGKEYSIQAADSIEITQSAPHAGQIKIAGRLVLPDGTAAAKYSETVSIHADSRLLEFDLTFEPLMAFAENDYAAVRYAWNDQTLDMTGGLSDSVQKLPEKSFLLSPLFVDLRNEAESLTFLSEGLPYHRRSGDQHIDTLLVSGDSGNREPLSYRLAVMVNGEQPLHAAMQFLLPPECWVVPASKVPKIESAWLFQIESKNVIALHWEPIMEDGKPVALMVYLKETAGRRAHFVLRSFLPPKSAAMVNLLGKELRTVKTEGDAVKIDLHAFELAAVQIDIN